MIRFLVIFLVCLGLAPLVPFLVEHRLGQGGGGEPAEALQAEALQAETGERIYRIARNRQGHFVADAQLNGRAVDMLVDTGATVTVLPESVAEEIGIFLQASDYKYPIRTANGTVRGAWAVIDKLRLGNIRLTNIEALVLQDRSLSEPLLGMSVLNRLQRFDMSGGTLVLVQ